MDNFTVAIYCFIDDYLKKCHPKDESHRKTTDAQIITTAIIAARYFGGNFVKAKSYLRSHWGFFYIDKSGFTRRLHGLENIMTLCFYTLSDVIKNLSIDSTYIIDSFPISVCHNIRISNCKILKYNAAYRGNCVSKREYFYGFKVQVIINSKGIPVDYFMLAGSYSDITGLKSMNIQLPEGSNLFADSAYTDYSFEDELYEIENINLLVDRRSNSKRKDPAYIEYFKKQMRKKIEVAFSEIERFLPKHIHAVTAKGFMLKVFIFIFAFTLHKYAAT
jgi:hypothetical protein